MNTRDKEYLNEGTREIHVPEYDTTFTSVSSDPFPEYRSSSAGNPNKNYYQRTQDEYPDEDPDDDDYDPGDTYDFGFAPRKKKASYRDYDNYDSHRRNSGNNRGHRRDDFDDDYGRRRHRKKRHPIRKFFLILLGILIALAIAIAVLLHTAFSKLNRVDPVADTTADSATEAAGVETYSERGVMNILLIGEDARAGETQTRSDTMIICSFNSKTRKITLVSLMRDTYVPIAGTDYSAKMNAAYAVGGLETLDETVQENFGIDIDGNAVVDLDGFLKAITSVGNLDIDLSYDEATYMNANEGLGSSVDNAQVNEPWGLVEGVNSLTPEQALCYARMRYVGNSDWDRVNRQKKIIQAAFAKMKSNPFSILKVLNQAAPSITTDMTDPYLTRACLYALLCGSDMNAATLPGDGMFTADSIDGQSVLVPDLNACHEALINYLYGSSANGDLFKAKASSTPSSTTGTTESDSGADSSEDTWTQTENAIPDDSLPFQDDPDGTTGTYDSSPSEPDGTANTDGNNNADGTYNDGGADNGYTGGAGYDTGSDGTDNYDAGQAPDNGGNDASGNTAGTDNTGYAPSDTYNSGDDAAGADNAGADNSAYAQNAADDGQAGY